MITDILMIIGGVIASYFVILGFMMHHAPTMKDFKEEENEK